MAMTSAARRERLISFFDDGKENGERARTYRA